MAEIITVKPYYPIEPVEPVEPIDPWNCPTCRSGIAPYEPGLEEAIEVEYTTKG